MNRIDKITIMAFVNGYLKGYQRKVFRECAKEIAEDMEFTEKEVIEEFKYVLELSGRSDLLKLLDEKCIPADELM